MFDLFQDHDSEAETYRSVKYTEFSRFSTDIYLFISLVHY
jgi:hypothetical protein